MKTKAKNNVVSISTGKATKSKRLSTEQRFHDSYTKQPSGCWYWKSDRGFFANGYSQLCADGETLYGHRYSWELANKAEIPNHLQCRHLCNIKRCVNPLHIEVGTAKQNANDRILAGTTNKGKALGVRKFTPAERERIAEMALDGKTAYAIAKDIGRSQPGVGLYLRKHRADMGTNVKAAAPSLITVCEALRDTLNTILDKAA